MEVEILIQSVLLKGKLELPRDALGLVVFSCGGINGIDISKKIKVAEKLNANRWGTLVFDLLTEEENINSENIFDIDLLTERLIGVTKWCMENEETKIMEINYLGLSTGSAAALSAAAYWGTKIKTVVSIEGRPDLAMDELDLIEAPTLLIVGGENKSTVDFNRKAYIKIGCVKKMETVVGTLSLFEEQGTVDKVATLASAWFLKHAI